MSERSPAWLGERIAQVSSIAVSDKLKVITDTTEFMNINRGDVLRLDGQHFLVTGYIYEARFGLSDEPKYWVKKAINLETSAQQIVKMSHHEEFRIQVGPLKIRCYRNPHKESRVLELVQGNSHFMQGHAFFDERNNEVRVVDFIRGKSIYDLILDMKLSHQEYIHTRFPAIFRKLRDCFEAVQFLHDNGLCHGDIRNDHILIEQDTGHYRWIDFDLTQDFSDLDIWSLGNILQFCVGMGMVTFREVFQSEEFPDVLKNSLTADDTSAFYEHRIMNLQKIYPYIPNRLNDILMRFALNTTRFYESAAQIVSDMNEVSAELPAA